MELYYHPFRAHYTPWLLEWVLSLPAARGFLYRLARMS